MANCGTSCAHRSFVESYRDQRRIEEDARDAVTMQYDTENRDYAREVGMITFRKWLEQSKGRRVQCPD